MWNRLLNKIDARMRQNNPIYCSFNTLTLPRVNQTTNIWKNSRGRESVMTRAASRAIICRDFRIEPRLIPEPEGASRPKTPAWIIDKFFTIAAESQSLNADRNYGNKSIVIAVNDLICRQHMAISNKLLPSLL